MGRRIREVARTRIAQERVGRKGDLAEEELR